MVHGVLIAGLWEQVIGNRAGRNWVCILRRLVFQAIRSEPRKPCAVMRRKSSVAFRPPVAVIEEFTRGPVLLCKLCEADRVVGGKQTRDRPSCGAGIFAAMTEDVNPEIEGSPLSGNVTRDGPIGRRRGSISAKDYVGLGESCRN